MSRRRDSGWWLARILLILGAAGYWAWKRLESGEGWLPVDLSDWVLITLLVVGFVWDLFTLRGFEDEEFDPGQVPSTEVLRQEIAEREFDRSLGRDGTESKPG